MSYDSDSAPSSRFIKIGAIAFAIAFGLHGIDHMRRGMAASPMPVMVGGLIRGRLRCGRSALVLRQHSFARRAAIALGFGSAPQFVYAHLLPTFLAGYQDSFVSGPRINVTWYSWFTAVAEIGAGLIFGYAGSRSPRASLAIPPTAKIDCGTTL